jgi:hypothetical protein
MLTCRAVIGLLMEYLEQTLGADVVGPFETHLERCPPCRAYVNTYQKTQELTRQVTRVPIPEDLKERLRLLLLEQLRRGDPAGDRQPMGGSG